MLQFLKLGIAWLVLGNAVQAARILAVFPYPSISHQVVFRALMVELAKRGHELVVVTTDPIDDQKLQNYTQIDLHHEYDLHKKYFNFVGDGADIWKLMDKFYEYYTGLMTRTFSHPDIERIISGDSKEHFDLIFVEYLYGDALYGLAARFNAPMIGIITLPLPGSGQYAMGSQLGFAYSPDPFVGYTDDMNFWQRVYNFYYQTRDTVGYQLKHLPNQDKIMRTYLGEDIPYVDELRRNVSMVFASSHTILSYPQAKLPTYLEVGGFQVKKEKKELPEDLKQFLDSAKEGFVYFSLGSNVKSNKLPEEKRNEFISAFAELPYKVVWKWESDNLPGKPSNVYISKWLPQQEVLGHPNIVAFIYQGGLQSTEEAINNLVPLIVLPFFSDQVYNANKIVSLGIAKRLHMDSLRKEEIKNAVHEVATDKGYKESILKVREVLNDRMVDPLDEAVWWTEYVIRHKGAPHLRTRARLMSWYQRELLDVIGFLAVILAIGLYAVYKLVSCIRRLVTMTYESLCRPKMKRN